MTSTTELTCARCHVVVTSETFCTFFIDTKQWLCVACGDWYHQHLDEVKAPEADSGEAPHACEACSFLSRAA